MHRVGQHWLHFCISSIHTVTQKLFLLIARTKPAPFKFCLQHEITRINEKSAKKQKRRQIIACTVRWWAGILIFSDGVESSSNFCITVWLNFSLLHECLCNSCFHFKEFLLHTTAPPHSCISCCIHFYGVQQDTNPVCPFTYDFTSSLCCSFAYHTHTHSLTHTHTHTHTLICAA